MNSSYDPEDLMGDLLYLRKAGGFTRQRFKRTPALRSVLGGRNDPFGVLQERFESAIQSLGDADTALLMQVYGLDARTRGLPDLQSRRDIVAKQLGVGRDAVADRDAAAVTRLRYQLLTGWYPKSPVSIRIPESHNGIVNHLVRVTTLVRDRRHVESRHHYRFFCTFDGAQYMAFTTAADAVVTASTNSFKLETQEVEHGLIHRFWHRSPMERACLYDLTFRIENRDPDEDLWITEESLAFHEPTRFAEFVTTFDGDRPTDIWKVHRITSHQRPGVPGSPNRIEIDSSGTARAKYYDVYGGLYSGIAWEW